MYRFHEAVVSYSLWSADFSIRMSTENLPDTSKYSQAGCEVEPACTNHNGRYRGNQDDIQLKKTRIRLIHTAVGYWTFITFVSFKYLSLRKFLFLRLSIYLSLVLSVCLSMLWLYVSLFFYMSVYPSLRLYICLDI